MPVLILRLSDGAPSNAAWHIGTKQRFDNPHNALQLQGQDPLICLQWSAKFVRIREARSQGYIYISRFCDKVAVQILLIRRTIAIYATFCVKVLDRALARSSNIS